MTTTPNQYKTSAGGAWANIPAEALTGTLRGGPVLLYPEPQAQTGAGQPCGAVGLPVVRLRSTWLNAAGLKWWFDRTAAGASVEFWLTALDPRANAWVEAHGWLAKPVFNPEAVLLAAAGAFYTDVTITLSEIETT